MARSIDTIREAGDIQRMFGGIASKYDFLNHFLSLNQDRVWRRKAVALSGASGPILDVCAGTGDMAIEWADAMENGTPIVAADFCHEMLVIGDRKFAERPDHARMRLLSADTMRLPFPDGVFGAVSVAFGIRNVSDLRAGMREMVRVARPGGKVLILDFTTPANLLIRPLYLLYFMILLPFIGNLVSGTEENAYGYLPRSVLNFPGPRRLMEMLEEEGLVDVVAHDLSFGIVNAFMGTKKA